MQDLFPLSRQSSQWCPVSKHSAKPQGHPSWQLKTMPQRSDRTALFNFTILPVSHTFHFFIYTHFGAYISLAFRQHLWFHFHNGRAMIDFFTHPYNHIAKEEARQAHAAEQAARLQLQRWQTQEDRSRPIAAPTLSADEGLAPGTFVQEEDVFSLQQLQWIIPASKYAYQMVDKAGKGYLARLSKLWDDMNNCGRAGTCPEHKIPGKRKREQQRSKCFFIGMCLCNHWRLRDFVTRLQQFLRRISPKGSFNKNYAKAGMLVLRISDGIADENALWFHISYVNLKTWVAACIPLRPAEDRIRFLIAQASNRIALDLEEPTDSRLGVAHWWRHFYDLDWSQKWEARVYYLRDDEGLLDGRFLPADIEVRSSVPTAYATLWTGSDELPPKPPRRRSGRARASAKGAAGSRPAASSSVPIPSRSDSDAAGSSSSSSGSSARTGERSTRDSLDSWQSQHNKDLETDDTPGASSVESHASSKVPPHIHHFTYYFTHSSLLRLFFRFFMHFFCLTTFFHSYILRLFHIFHVEHFSTQHICPLLSKGSRSFRSWFK